MMLAMIAKSLILAGLITIMLSMGMTVTIEQVVASSKKWQSILLCLLANFVLVPVVTIGLLFFFEAYPMVSVGFFILAICPGAPMGPPFSAIAKGDVPSAIGQMVILAAVSAIVSPLILSLLLSQLLPSTELHVDFLGIAEMLLISQGIPLAAGFAIHHLAPELTRRISKSVSLLANLLLASAVVLIVVREYETLETVRLRGWIGMLMLFAASIGIGWLCGGPTRATRKTLAITTGIRNVAVGLSIASANFANTPAVTAVVAYALVSIAGTFGCALLFAWMPEAIALQSVSSPLQAGSAGNIRLDRNT